MKTGSSICGISMRREFANLDDGRLTAGRHVGALDAPDFISAGGMKQDGVSQIRGYTRGRPIAIKAYREAWR